MNARSDNLYRFCAIAGVVIALFALTVPFYFSDSLARRAAGLEPQTRRAEIEVNHLYVNTEALAKRLEPSEPGKPAKPALSENERTTALKTLEESRLTLNIKFAEIKLANAELARLQITRLVVNLVGAIAFITGVLLSLYGIQRWRYKVQAYHDYQLEAAVDKIFPGNGKK